MFTGFEKIVEARIEKARREGVFKDLPGSGTPIKFEDNNHIPEDLRLAHKILKNADCVPPEIEIRKEIRQTEDLLAGMEDEKDKYRAMKKLNLLIMKLNVLRKADIAHDMPQKYVSAVIERLE